MTKPKPTKFQKLMHRLRSSYVEKGFFGVLRQLHMMVVYRVHSWIFDKYWAREEISNVANTTHLETLSIKGENREHGTEYTPSSYLALQWILAELPSDHHNWSFVDIGAGRGRVVSFAAMKPFKRVIGVEFAKELYRDAVAYLAKIPSAKTTATQVEMLNQDATRFRVPDGPCIFYLFNPFDGLILGKFIDHLSTSYKQNPRSLIIAYYNPNFNDVLQDDLRVNPVPLSLSARAKFALFAPHSLMIYEIKM